MRGAYRRYWDEHGSCGLFLVHDRCLQYRTRSLSLEEIVEGGLCIGCGLCQSVAGAEKIQMVLTPEGRERPVARGGSGCGDAGTHQRDLPRHARRRRAPAEAPECDAVWGPAQHLAIGYAGDPAVRHRASTGGVLTALGQFLLASGRVKFILHVAASRRSRCARNGA